MAFDKKPSMNSNRGTIGSAEELDTYGVWVKSEPQDLTAGMAGAVNFETEAVPYETGFDTGFDDDFGTSDAGFDDLEQEISEIDFEDIADNEPGNFDENITASIGQEGSGEASSQLLMKISGELSSIRNELNALKKEFADIRAGTASGVMADARSDTFFEDEDEKIALTGDEMESFLSSAEFAEEQEEGFDALRAADEAALKELSEQNEAAVSDEDTNFDNLGIGLDNDAEAAEEPVFEETGFLEEELPQEDMALEETEVLEEELPQEDMALEETGFFEEELPQEDMVIEETEILEEESLAAADTSLDDDFETLAFEDTSSLEMPESFEDVPSLEELSVEETAELAQEEDRSEDIVPFESSEQHEEIQALQIEGAEPHTPAPDNSGYLEEDPFVLDSSDFGDMSLDNLSEDISSEDTVIEDTSVSETVADISSDESAGDIADLNLDDGSLDLSLDDFSGEDMFSLDEETAEETVEAIKEQPLDADLSLEEPALGEDISFDDFGSEIELDTAADSIAADEPEAGGFELGGDSSLEGGLVEESITDEPEAGSLELSGDSSLESGLVEESVGDEPESGLELSGDTLSDDLAFSDADDISIDDFGTSVDLDEKIEIEANDSGLTEDIGDLNDISDDSITQVIPEGFEVNAEEAAVSLDDDIGALDDDLSIGSGETGGLLEAAEASSGEELGIPAGLKSDLKNVLFYMDHLLESLPEDKIEEFAKSEYFDTYKKIFKELGLV